MLLDKQSNMAQQHDVDVEPDPVFNHPTLPNNPAHTEIYTIPPCDKKAFRILRESLALLANARAWEIKPPDTISKGY